MSTQVALEMPQPAEARPRSHVLVENARRPAGITPGLTALRSLGGVVVAGDRRGRTLGFPTANIAVDDGDKSLRQGVYAVRVAVEDHVLPGVAAYGKPMFDNHRPPFETHIFDFSGDIYGRRITVHLVSFLREPRVFASLDELIASMNEDARRAREILTANQEDGSWLR